MVGVVSEYNGVFDCQHEKVEGGPLNEHKCTVRGICHQQKTQTTLKNEGTRTPPKSNQCVFSDLLSMTLDMSYTANYHTFFRGRCSSCSPYRQVNQCTKAGMKTQKGCKTIDVKRPKILWLFSENSLIFTHQECTKYQTIIHSVIPIYITHSTMIEVAHFRYFVSERRSSSTGSRRNANLNLDFFFCRLGQ